MNKKPNSFRREAKDRFDRTSQITIITLIIFYFCIDKYPMNSAQFLSESLHLSQHVLVDIVSVGVSIWLACRKRKPVIDTTTEPGHHDEPPEIYDSNSLWGNRYSR